MKYKISILFIGILFILSSCCTKKGCPDFEEPGLVIDLVGSYNAQERDNFYIIQTDTLTQESDTLKITFYNFSSGKRYYEEYFPENIDIRVNRFIIL